MTAMSVVGPSSPVRALPLGQGSYKGIAWPSDNLRIQSWDEDAIPTTNTNDVQRSHAVGDWTGDDYSGSRLLQVTFVVMGATNQEYRQWCYALEQLWVPMDGIQPLLMMDGTRTLNVKVRKRQFEHYVGGRSNAGLLHVEWYAADPLYYTGDAAGVPHKVILSLAQLTVAGRAYNLTYNRVYPPALGTGLGIAINNGNQPAPPRLRIFGPCTNPRVFNDTTGQVLSFTGTLDAVTYLDVDGANYTIYQNSDPTLSRFSWLNVSASQWWRIVPGTNNLRFTCDTVSGAAQVEVSWSDASL